MSDFNDAIEAAAATADDLIAYDARRALGLKDGADVAQHLRDAIRALKRTEGEDAYAAGMREGRERERADVVAMIRSAAQACGEHDRIVLNAIAEGIERGQHIGVAAESGERGGE